MIASSSESVSPAGAMAANDHTFVANAAPGEVESDDEVVTFPIQNRSEFGGAALKFKNWAFQEIKNYILLIK